MKDERKEDISRSEERSSRYYDEMGKLEKQKKEQSLLYLKRFEETRQPRYLRHAIKNDYELIFKDQRIRAWLYEIRYTASRPYLDRKTKEARDFIEEFELLKLDNRGEMEVFFGSGYHLESCLGIKFAHGSKWQLMAYDSAVLVHFATNLAKKWQIFNKEVGQKTYRDRKQKEKRVIEFCAKVGVGIAKKELSWGSVYDAPDVALTVIGIANLQRWNELSKRPRHDLNKILGDFPYFSFGTLGKLYKKAKKDVDNSKLIEVKNKIDSALNEENPFVIEFGGIPYGMHLSINPRRITLTENR